MTSPWRSASLSMLKLPKSEKQVAHGGPTKVDILGLSVEVGLWMRRRVALGLDHRNRMSRGKMLKHVLLDSQCWGTSRGMAPHNIDGKYGS